MLASVWRLTPATSPNCWAVAYKNIVKDSSVLEKHEDKIIILFVLQLFEEKKANIMTKASEVATLDKHYNWNHLEMFIF